MYRILFLIVCSSLFAVEIQLGKEIVRVEIADTDASREKGLMGRKELREGEGMLFIYPSPQKLGFWMKNTIIPLSIGFFGKDRALINTAEMEPLSGRARSARVALYALEVPKGWFERHGIAPGEKFSFLDQ
ncbi:MAG TPA: DUF192 domain-containing protein [Chlamydiales bacterium]|nr:DUF192 domain-containing protein [Chlamydiales bacterium]